jgi:hypothetical protein
MYDIHVIFSETPGELARFGQLLGCHGVGAGGRRCVWCQRTLPGCRRRQGQRVLGEAGFNVQSVSKPLIRKLKQERPGDG